MGILKTVATAAALAVSLVAGGANANTITWTANGHFDSAQITFSAFTTNELSSITGNGIFHEHNSSNADTAFIDVLLDGTWTNIFSQTITNTGVALDTLGPLGFSTGSVSGLRLRANPGSNQTFHNIDGDVFNFAQVNVGPTPVPLPAAAPLLLVALGGLGFAARRRKAA